MGLNDWDPEDAIRNRNRLTNDSNNSVIRYKLLNTLFNMLMKLNDNMKYLS